MNHLQTQMSHMTMSKDNRAVLVAGFLQVCSQGAYPDAIAKYFTPALQQAFQEAYLRSFFSTAFQTGGVTLISTGVAHGTAYPVCVYFGPVEAGNTIDMAFHFQGEKINGIESRLGFQSNPNAPPSSSPHTAPPPYAPHPSSPSAPPASAPYSPSAPPASAPYAPSAPPMPSPSAPPMPHPSFPVHNESSKTVPSRVTSIGTLFPISTTSISSIRSFRAPYA
eukprot:TRINITY_DN5841_c0_g1_i2.p1 TRINITY_DN5841_c0_g1~~TRINITY_DN5841_c0_g1_i2.p1  ORF type:complete len:222 (-),score=51.76 TRINITY_DN5841_c0_g1_i2:57-722(-)